MFLMFCTQLVFAGGFSDALDAARISFSKGDHLSMARHLAQAKKSAMQTNKIVDPEDLALIMFLSGLAAENRGEEPLDFWRKTFALYLKYEGEADLFISKAQADLFFAVRMEMEYAEKKTAFIPSKLGLAKIFIDGQEKQHENTILPGEHLLQIQCPKGEIVSQWSRVDEDPQWLTMCPYEIDIHASNKADDPFSLDGLDSSMEVEPSDDTQEKQESKEKAKPEELQQELKAKSEKQNSQESVSYFSGVRVQKMKAKSIFWAGLEGGFFVDSKEELHYHGDLVTMYQFEPIELEVHLGLQLSGGLNYTIMDGTLLGVHGGYHILHDDLFFDARFRQEISIAEGVRGYGRLRFGYLYNIETLFSGVDVGLVLSVF